MFYFDCIIKIETINSHILRLAKTLGGGCFAGLLAAFLSACAQAVEPQPFESWVLALSWSPQYCASTQRPDELQCDRRRAYGFIVHGLWPQGGPDKAACPKPAKLPRRYIERMLPLMPSPGLIQHEWNKHGACTGWGPDEYFATIERAWKSVRIPHAYQDVRAYQTLPMSQLEREFAQDNPGFSADSIGVQCKGPYLQEIRLCLDKDLAPRNCGTRVRDRCGKQLTLRPQR